METQHKPAPAPEAERRDPINHALCLLLHHLEITQPEASKEAKQVRDKIDILFQAPRELPRELDETVKEYVDELGAAVLKKLEAMEARINDALNSSQPATPPLPELSVAFLKKLEAMQAQIDALNSSQPATQQPAPQSTGGVS
jgi:hypothetical protein